MESQADPASPKDWLSVPSKWRDSTSELIGSDETLTQSLQTSLAEQDARFVESQKGVIAVDTISQLHRPTSPRSPNVNASFFSLLRPSSPRVSLQQSQQGASSTQGRDDATTSFYSSAASKRGIEKSKDSSASGSEASTRSRRPSSVFDHVGGMLDRFGRHLHSRGDSKEDRRVLSNSVANGSAVETSISDENVSDAGIFTRRLSFYCGKRAANANNISSGFFPSLPSFSLLS
jgi:hypothetical protein